MFILRNRRCTSEITKRISIHFGLVLWEKILALFVRNLRYRLNINELIKKRITYRAPLCVWVIKVKCALNRTLMGIQADRIEW